MMNTTKYHDENADSFTKLAHPCVSRSVPSKSPLKTLNDARRLTSSPIGIKETEDIKTPRTSPYTYIRQLDSAERWIERTSVVTKQDHLINLHIARSILEDLICSLPLSTDNVWIQQSLSDDSGGKRTTKAPSCETRQPIDCPTPDHCLDVDSLADLLFDLNIGHRVANVGEIKFHGDDPAQYASNPTAKVETVLRKVCDKGLGVTIQYSLNTAAECYENLEKVTSTTDCKKLEEKTVLEVSANDSASKILSTDVQQFLDEEKENLTSIVEMCQSTEIVKFGMENEHCIPIKVTSDKNLDTFKPMLQLGNSSVCEQQTSVRNEVKHPIVESDPFKPKLQLVNSEQQAAVEDVKDPILESDPFKSKLQLVNSEQQDAVEDVKDPILESDPFKPKLQLVNSEQQDAVEDVKDPILESDPFKPKLQLVNSPVAVKDPIFELNPLKPELQLMNFSVCDQQVAVEDLKDPIKPKLQLVNSEQQAAVEDLKDPIKPKLQLVNFEQQAAVEDLKDPIKPKLQLVNFEQQAAVEDLKDSIKPKLQLVNSEQQAAVKDPIKPKLQLVNSHVAVENVKDPILESDTLKPELQIMNFSACDQQVAVEDPILESDPFKLKPQLVNSPGCEQQAALKDPILESDPLKPKLQLIKSPVAVEDVKDQIVESDPLKSKLQLVNASVCEQQVAVEDVKDPILESDPFKPKLQLVNSADEQQTALEDLILESDPLKPKLELVTAYGFEQQVAMEDIKNPILESDPMRLKLQLVNASACQQQVSVENVKDLILESDPFKPKLQIMNSPGPEQKSAVKDPILESDPFKPKLQIMNSPAGVQQTAVKDPDLESDPFKPKLQIMNSPGCEQQTAVKDPILESDPFKPKLQIMNSPAGVQQTAVKDPDLESDPFKPKLQIMNSPGREQKSAVKDPILESDPFKPKLQIMNSPAGVQQTAVKDPDLESDPFKPKLQIMNSPGCEQQTAVKDPDLESDPFKPKLQIMNSPAGEQQTAVEKDVDNDLIKPNIQLMNQALVRNEKDSHSDIRIHECAIGHVDHIMPADITMHATQMLDLDATEVITHDICDASKPCTVGNHKLSDDASEIDHTEDNNDRRKDARNVADVQNSENNTEKKCQLLAMQDIYKIDPFQSTRQVLNSPVFTNKLNSISPVSTPSLQVLITSSAAGKTETEVETAIYGIPQESLNEFLPVEVPCHQKSLLTGNTFSGDTEITPRESIGQEIQTSVGTTKVANGASFEANMPHVNIDAEMNTSKTHSGSNDLSCGSAQSVKSKSLYNSPEVNTYELTIRSQVGAVPEDDIDPFKSDSQLGNSLTKPTSTTSNTPENDIPTLHKSETCITTTGNVSSNKSDVPDLEVSTTLKENCGKISCASEQFVPLSIEDERTGVASGRSLPESKNVAAGDNFPVGSSLEEAVDFGDSEFIPATQAFNDPSFLDMLEKSSNTCTLNPKRGSVLMKFDPLQEQRDQGFVRPASPGPMRKPGRISDAFNLSKTCVGADDSVCLFGTPPRVSRRRTLTRKVHNTRAHIIEEEAAAAEVDMFFGSDDEGDGMDTILHDNLMPLAVSGARLVDIEESATYTVSQVKQIRAELTMHYQELLLKKDKEFQQKAKQQEETAAQECARMNSENDTYKSQIKSLQGKLKDLSDVMKEYADLITQVSAEKAKVLAEGEKLKVQITEMQAANNQMHVDNKEFEKSFDDLFHRYEKLKGTLEKVAQNEKILKQAIQEAHEKYNSGKETTKKIREAAEAKITELEEKCQKLSASSKDEVVRLEATVKRKEMQIKGLETSLEQTTKENKELTELCDQLINKVSHPKTSS